MFAVETVNYVKELMNDPKVVKPKEKLAVVSFRIAGAVAALFAAFMILGGPSGVPGALFWATIAHHGVSIGNNINVLHLQAKEEVQKGFLSRFFGLGESVTEPDWREYLSGTLLGYAISRLKI